jgi:universal stress protein A
MTTFKKILVPVDFSEHSDEALKIGLELARRCEASLSIVHVYEPMVYALPEGYTLASPDQINDLFTLFEKELSKLKARALEAGVARVDTSVRQGIAAQEICAAAEGGKFDLVVMGTQGRRGLSHLLMGSVAERVLRLAPCPVLTVKASKKV